MSWTNRTPFPDRMYEDYHSSISGATYLTDPSSLNPRVPNTPPVITRMTLLKSLLLRISHLLLDDSQWATQAAVVAKNIQALIEGRTPQEIYVPGPAGIHLTLGLKKNVIFRNPNQAEGQTEPVVMEKTDGEEDMNVEGFWKRLGVEVNTAQQYHL